VELAHLPEGVCCNLHIPAEWLSASARKPTVILG